MKISTESEAPVVCDLEFPTRQPINNLLTVLGLLSQYHENVINSALVFVRVITVMWIFFICPPKILSICVRARNGHTHYFKVARPIPVASRRLWVGCRFGHGIICVYQLRCKVWYYFGVCVFFFFLCEGSGQLLALENWDSCLAAYCLMITSLVFFTFYYSSKTRRHESQKSKAKTTKWPRYIVYFLALLII